MTTDAAERAPRARAIGMGADVRRVLHLLGDAHRGIRWYVHSLMGDDAYAVYAAHLRRHHPGVEPIAERQFWRDRSDDQSRNPGARCC